MSVLLQRIAKLERRNRALSEQVRYWRARCEANRGRRSARQRQVCSGCGVPYDVQTLGCRSCTFRHSFRRRRKVAA